MAKIKLKHLFRSDTSIFALTTGLKFSGIFVLVIALICYCLWLVLAMDNVFFESQGYLAAKTFREAYYDSVLKSASDMVPYLVLFVICLFFAGVFISKILLRPFAVISCYCERKLEGKNASYEPDSFSDYKLLTRFSDFFFQYLEDSTEKGKLVSNSIPPQFLGIHKPVFERAFFFHFFLLTLAIALVSVTMLNMAVAYLREDMVDLAVKTIKIHGFATSHFFQSQAPVFDSISVLATIIVIASYVALSFHLYSKVSGAIFGYFSTMRSFMKGDFKARVRLLGYNHIRPHGLVFNRYLKFIAAKISTEEKAGK